MVTMQIMTSCQRRGGALVIALALASLAAPAAHARARDGSGAWRPDGRAINGSFGQTVGSGPDRWLSATSAGYDVTVWLADVFGNRIGNGMITFSGCGSGPCIRTNSVYAFKGRFGSTSQDSMCAYYRWYWTSEPDIVCFDLFGSTLYAGNPAENNTAFTYAMPSSPTGGNGFAVGDFDGDGYDEIVTYNRSNGSSPRFWRYDRSLFRFVENTSMAANLGGLNWPGGVVMYAGNFHDADGLTGLDDLAVYNTTTHEIMVFESRRPGLDYARFWGWYGPASLGITGNEELTVARYSTSGYDALVTNTFTGSGNRGLLRAFSLAYPPTDISASSAMANMQTSFSTGFTGNVHLVWGDINSWDGNARDDTFQFFDSAAQYTAYDAHPGSPPPWWAWFTQNTNYLKYELNLL